MCVYERDNERIPTLHLQFLMNEMKKLVRDNEGINSVYQKGHLKNVSEKFCNTFIVYACY